MSWSWEFMAPGTWLIFGIVFLPVYLAFLGWFLGEPRDVKTGVMGLGYFVGLILALWVPLYILTLIIGLVFF